MGSPARPLHPLDLLLAPPGDKYALVELAVEWDDLVAVEAQLAAALRLFVITRDPLDWLPDRGSAWATVNANGDALELPVYVALREIARRTAAADGMFLTAVGQLCETVLHAATRCQGVILAGAYPELAFRGQALGLLTTPDAAASHLGQPTVTLESPDWEPIGLGAIQDLVQDAFGPVDFDRSTVTLPPSENPRPGCPACAGDRFGFPGELSDAQDAMCRHHEAGAAEIIDSRIARAQASNPSGWRAIAEGSARINGLPGLAVPPVPQRRGTSTGRNDPCPCGSGRKYKHCCGT